MDFTWDLKNLNVLWYFNLFLNQWGFGGLGLGVGSLI